MCAFARALRHHNMPTMLLADLLFAGLTYGGGEGAGEEESVYTYTRALLHRAPLLSALGGARENVLHSYYNARRGKAAVDGRGGVGARRGGPRTFSVSE